MTIELRVRALVRAAFYGWIAGWLAVLPFQILEAVRNAGFDARLFAEMVALSIGLYSLLTLAVSCYFCCLFLLPAIWVLNTEKIVAHRMLWTIFNMLAGCTLVGLRAHVWTAFQHDGVGTTNFWIWALFASVFFGVAAEVYVRRMIGSGPNRAAASSSQPG